MTLQVRLQGYILRLNGDSYIGRGALSGSQDVGEVRVGFTALAPSVVSVVGRLDHAGGIAPYRTAAGDALLLVNAGPATSQEMFAAAKLQNLATTWALRLFGFLLLSGGLGSLAAPCVALVEWVPLLGDLASCGALLLACGIALPLTFVTVAAAWAFYRPLFALGLLFASGVAIVVALHYQRMARRHSTSQQRAMCHYTPVAATTGPAFEYGGPPSAASTSRYGEPPPPYMESEECPGVCMQQRGGRVPMTHYSRAIEMPVPPHAVVYDTNESNLKGASGIYLDGAPSPSAPPYHNH